MASLDELLAKRSPASRAKIDARADEMRREVMLNQLQEELSISQSELAEAIGVKLSTIAEMELTDNDPRLSTLKRYVSALGGELSIDVILPTGKRVEFYL